MAQDLHARWRALAHQLREDGIDGPTLSMLDRHVAGLAATPVAAAGYAMLASEAIIHLAQPMPEVVTEDRAHFGAPLQVLPVLAWRRRHPAYVSVLIDRVGGEVTAVPAASLAGSTQSITGPDDEIERNAPGGWAQARYQRRAEDSWHHNAVAVAGAAIRALDEVGGDLLVVAGDVRAVQMLRDHLNQHVNRDLQLRLVPGGRSPDGSTQAHLRAVADTVAAYAGQRDAALFDRRMSGPPAEIVEGVSATLAALAQGRLQTLFVADDLADRRRAWLGPDVLCAEQPHTTPEQPLMAGRLTDVAVRAALLTDADIHILSAGQAVTLHGRIGGRCRYRQEAPSG